MCSVTFTTVTRSCRAEQLAFSFNGGKDSTAVLHLLLQGVRIWQTEAGKEYKPEQGLLGIRTFFFLTDLEFPEVHQFVKVCCELYRHSALLFPCIHFEMSMICKVPTFTQAWHWNGTGAPTQYCFQ
jgi:3'-phosphoadenosine 5'-phosphosulfate sulfotransferase (PAPS reductase)/FAD synthetase